MRNSSGDFPISYEGFKAIHKHIFQDVYDWAGQSRTLTTRKVLNSAITLNFAPWETIDKEMKSRFDQISSDKGLQSKDPKIFIGRAAEHISEINVIHPFREGNTRTQLLFLRNLAHQAGHDLSISKISQGQWKYAAYEGYNCRYDAMANCIASAINGLASSQQKTDEKKQYIEKLLADYDDLSDAYEDAYSSSHDDSNDDGHSSGQ